MFIQNPVCVFQSHFTCSSKTLESDPKFFNKRIHISLEKLLKNKEKQTTALLKTSKNLQGFMLCEKCQSQKAIYCLILLI